MTVVFADTSFYLALLNASDQYHSIARQAAASIRGRTITTAWVLTEVADALSRAAHRALAARFIADLRSDPRVLTVPPSEQLFEPGLQLYADWSDKD